MVVTGNREHAAVGRSAGQIGVPKRITRAVDARALAVPDAEDAIDLGPRKHADVLRTPDRSRGKVFVDRRTEHHIVRIELRLRAPQLEVVATHRRAAITRNVAPGIETCRCIAQALLNRQSHQSLNAGHVEPAFGRKVAIVQAGDQAQAFCGRVHRAISCSRPAAGGTVCRMVEVSIRQATDRSHDLTPQPESTRV